MTQTKILTVDDSLIIRKVVIKYSKAAGCDVVEASNGVECLEMASKEKPDLIVLDVNMPVMNGDDALIKLKEAEDTKAIPVMMLTTEARKEVVVELIKKGASQYIVKPFTADLFYQKINAILHLWEGDFSPEKVVSTEGAAQGNGQVVLVIEDKVNVVEQIKKAIPDGYILKRAQTESEAILTTKKWQPEFIFIDLKLEQTHPLHLFEELQKICPTTTTKYVAMCLRTATESVKKAQEFGISDILYKPFGEEEVSTLLSSNSSSAQPSLKAEEDIAVITLPGQEETPKQKINSTEFEKIKDLINDAAEQGYTKICFDLASLTDLDIDSIKELIVLNNQCQTLQVKYVFVNSASGVKEKIAGVAEAKDLPWQDDLSKAKEDVSD